MSEVYARVVISLSRRGYAALRTRCMLYRRESRSFSTLDLTRRRPQNFATETLHNDSPTVTFLSFRKIVLLRFEILNYI